MKSKFNALIQLCFTFSIPHKFVSLPFNASHIKTPFVKSNLWWTGAAFATTTMVTPLTGTLEDNTTITMVPPLTGTLEDNHNRNALEDTGDRPKDSMDVFRRWGCSETDISKIFLRRPTLRSTDLTDLQSKLSILGKLGLSASDLVKIINCRPRFLNCCINHCFDERLEYLQALFGSKKMLLKAITRNPSLLVYDFHNTIIPIIATYERMGVSRNDLIPMLLSRPTLISRSSFTDEKMYYIQKIGLSKDSKMYKYVVTLIAISRLETIREKVANFEKCGFSEDEVWGLLRRAPMVLTLSIDKVQRNMTFVLGTMKLPASTVIGFPSLLYSNLETVLKPRVLLARKIKDMGLVPQFKGCPILGPLSMKENRFVEAFIECHSKDVASELMEYYTNVKDVKRLAETSKRNLIKGFPF